MHALYTALENRCIGIFESPTDTVRAACGSTAVYLHCNGLVHRDLTGNNVLMIAGPRAKITDFGMSKLASVNPRMTALTLCPGNVLYMSPEALDEAKTYTAKLDVFSFGVIVIQILTRQFPNSTDRFRTVHEQKNEEDSEDDEGEDKNEV